MIAFGDPRLPARFWAKVHIGTDSDCWTWIGAKYRKGYGQFRVAGVWKRAHRLAYEALVGPISDGLVIDHLCRVTNCVNPSHMEPVANAENMRRGIQSFDTRTHCLKGLHELTEENIRNCSNGRQRCRDCQRAADRRRYATKYAMASSPALVTIAILGTGWASMLWQGWTA